MRVVATAVLLEPSVGGAGEDDAPVGSGNEEVNSVVVPVLALLPVVAVEDEGAGRELCSVWEDALEEMGSDGERTKVPDPQSDAGCTVLSLAHSGGSESEVEKASGFQPDVRHGGFHPIVCVADPVTTGLVTLVVLVGGLRVAAGSIAVVLGSVVKEDAAGFEVLVAVSTAVVVMAGGCGPVHHGRKVPVR